MAAAKVHTFLRRHVRVNISAHCGGHDHVSGVCGPLRPKQRPMMRHDGSATSAIAVAAISAVGGRRRAGAGRFAVGAELHAAARLIAGAAVESARRQVAAGRHRNPARSGLEDLLALSRRFRRAADTRFHRFGERQIGDRAVAGAGALRRWRRRQFDRLYAATSCCRCGSSRRTPASRRALHVKVGYAVCGKLCVPAEADLGLTLSGKAGAEDRHCRARCGAKPRVPRARAALGARSRRRSRHPLHASRKRPAAMSSVVVEVAAPAGAPVDLFVEGPTADWALPLPEPDRPPAETRRSAALHFRPRRAAARRQRGRRNADASPPSRPADAIEVEAASRLIRPARLIYAVDTRTKTPSA